MKLTNKHEQIIGEAFENVFNDIGMLGNAFLRDNEALYEQVVTQALANDGFPEDANHHNVSHDMELVSKIDYDMWAEIYAYDEDIEDMSDESELKSRLEREETVINCILNNLDKVDFDVVVNDDVIEFKDSFPDYDHFQELFYTHFDENEFIEYLESDSSNVQDAYDEAIREDFGSIDNAPQNLEFAVASVNIGTDIIENLFEQYDPEQHSDAITYMNDVEVYDDVINIGNFDPEIELLYNQEDMLEENPTPEYLEQEMGYFYDEDDYKDFIIQYDQEAILDELHEALAELDMLDNIRYGSYSAMEADGITWDISINPNPDLSPLAEEVFDKNIVPNAYETVSAFCHSEEFYEAIADRELVTWFVEITSDPEDIGEE